MKSIPTLCFDDPPPGIGVTVGFKMGEKAPSVCLCGSGQTLVWDIGGNEGPAEYVCNECHGQSVRSEPYLVRGTVGTDFEVQRIHYPFPIPKDKK